MSFTQFLNICPAVFQTCKPGFKLSHNLTGGEPCEPCLGNCHSSACDVVTGLCSQGCSEGYINQPFCDVQLPNTSLPTFKPGYIGEKAIQLVAPLSEFFLPAGFLDFYYLRAVNLNVTVANVTLVNMDQYVGHIILTGLQPNSTYTLHVSIYRQVDEQVNVLDTAFFNVTTGLYWV